MHLLLIGVLIVLGVYLLVAGARMSEAAKNQLVKSNAVKAIQGVYTMGVVFLVAGLSLGLCAYRCKECDLSAGSEVYLTLFILLGIVLITLGALVIKGDIPETKNWAVSTLVIGVIFVVFCGALIAQKHAPSLATKLSFMRHSMMN